MNLQDKLEMHQAAIKNIEARIELQDNIVRFNKMIDLKKVDPMGAGVQSWSISELESNINEYKDMIYDYEKIYKELVS